MKSPQTFNEKFVELFAENIVGGIKYGSHIKMSLLTASLREYTGLSSTSEDTDPYSFSKVFGSIVGKFPKHQIEAYHYRSHADRDALNLYLRNLTGIKSAISQKIDECPDIENSKKLELKKSANEAFAILQNLKQQHHETETSEIVYGRKDDGTAKAMLIIKHYGRYYGDIIEHSGVTSQLPPEVPEGSIEMKELGRNRSQPKTQSAPLTSVEKKMHGKGLLLSGGTEFEGDFVEGKMHGKGKIKYHSSDRKGDMYEGNFVDGTIKGRGTYTWKNGDTYSGELYLSNNGIRVINEGTFTSVSGRSINYNFPKGYSAALTEVVLTQDQITPSNSAVSSSFKIAFPPVKTSGISKKINTQS